MIKQMINYINYMINKIQNYYYIDNDIDDNIISRKRPSRK